MYTPTKRRRITIQHAALSDCCNSHLRPIRPLPLPVPGYLACQCIDQAPITITTVMSQTCKSRERGRERESKQKKRANSYVNKSQAN